MHFQYRYEVERDGDRLLVHFPEVPGAATEVEPGEALEPMARDCLVAALGGYVELRRPIPSSGKVGGRATITLDITTSAKLALASIMAERGVSNVSLGAALGVDEKAVRRLLDLDHPSRMDRLEQALALFNRELRVSVREKTAIYHLTDRDLDGAKKSGRP